MNRTGGQGATIWIVLAGVVAAGGLGLGHWQALAAPKLTPMVCYEAAFDPKNPGIKRGAFTLTDQFNTDPVRAFLGNLRELCTPVLKKELHDRKPNPVQQGDHLLCYWLDPVQPGPKGKWIFSDQFGTPNFRFADKSTLLCEPSDKEIEVLKARPNPT